VFLDTETTSLRGDTRLPWEIAMIRVDEFADLEPDSPNPDAVEKIRMFIDGVDLSDADPFSLQIGRFYERHPRQNGLAVSTDTVVDSTEPSAGRPSWVDGPFFDLYTEEAAMHIVDRWTRGATIVGAVPSFDMQTLETRMRWHGLCPSWSHRPVCVENLVAGRVQWLPENRLQGMGKAAEQLGIKIDLADAHTAMGDAELARRIFDEVFA
ncbi:hypothetical protein, partial [Rhodococcoides fascians]|uniref:hypothetical protein n=1 Tax=Rhodococcoides fascians TaxID=1828 RepID=UPI001ABEFF3F